MNAVIAHRELFVGTARVIQTEDEEVFIEYPSGGEPTADDWQEIYKIMDDQDLCFGPDGAWVEGGWLFRDGFGDRVMLVKESEDECQ